MNDENYANDVVEFINFCELKGVAVSEKCLEAWKKSMEAAEEDEAIIARRISAASQMLSRLRGEQNEPA